MVKTISSRYNKRWFLSVLGRLETGTDPRFKDPVLIYNHGPQLSFEKIQIIGHKTSSSMSVLSSKPLFFEFV
jgi:hypothetical protein